MTHGEFSAYSHEILSDMRAFITYTPDRETDIRQFMINYLDNERYDQDEILIELKHCIDGEPYSEPDFGNDSYTFETVDKFWKALEKFYNDCVNADGDSDRIETAIDNVTRTVNDLDEQAEHGLIDTWRREKLCELIDETALEFGYDNPQNKINMTRAW